METQPKNRARTADGRAGRRSWTGLDLRRLKVLCIERPRKSWSQIGRILTRTAYACQRRALSLKIRKGSPMAPYLPCRTTGLKQQRAISGCNCEACSWKRLARRSHDKVKCASCGEVTVVVGKGPKRMMFVDGEQPGAEL